MKQLPRPVVPAPYRARDGAGSDYGVTDPPDWRTIDWTDHLHSLEIDGRPVNYVDIGEQGDSRPIVFIHGLSGQWQNWLENIPRFAQERRVIALDLPGFGASAMPQEKISIELYGRAVAELCQRLDLAPVVLVGNSMGGFVAAEVAIRRPDVAERMVLVAAAGVSQADLSVRPVEVGAKALVLLTTRNVSQLRLVARRPRVRHWVLSLVARHPAALKADLAFEGMIKGAGKPGFEDALMANLSYDFRDRLPQVGCPTLILWGEKDAVIPVRDAERFRELIPGARKLVLNDTGHVPMLERPPTFNAELARFLDHAVQEGELEGELDSSPERHQRSSV